MTISETGTLPSGVTFTDNGDGTATLGGSPDPGTAGAYPLTITATNGIVPDATQDFTLTVNPLPPSITSASTTAFSLNTPGVFTVQATGDPTPSISESGALPSGVTFTDNGNGTATLGGTPDAGTVGTYPLTITATNGVAPDATQDFTLSVNLLPPSITSPTFVAFVEGFARNFTVHATGGPTPSISESGTLPSGVTFTDNGDGTATLGGTPDAGTAETYPLTFTATNGVAPDATQDFVLNVVPPVQPSITSAGGVTFVEGFARGIDVTVTGDPTPNISASGALPTGVTFTDNGVGTATLAGTPALGTAGTYPLTITATNGAGPDATQAFTLTVIPAPPNSAVDGTCTALSLLGNVTPPLVAMPTPVVAGVKTVRPGSVVWGVGFSFEETPPAGGSCNVGGASFNDVQAAAKLSGIGSCDSASTDPRLYPLNGKLQLRYVGGALRSDTYVRIAGFDPVPGPDVIGVTGIVTKGLGLGATVGGELFFDPVLRATSDDDPVAIALGAAPGQVLKSQYFFDNSQVVLPCGAGGVRSSWCS